MRIDSTAPSVTPSPSGTIVVANSPLIAPVDVGFDLLQTTYTPTAYVQWDFQVAQANGYNPDLQPAYQQQFNGYLTLYYNQNRNDWSDYNLAYTTTNPYLARYHIKTPGSYPVKVLLDGIHQAQTTVNVIAPPAPTGLAKTGGGVTWVGLSWNPVAGVEGYRIEMQTVAGCTFSSINGTVIRIGSKEWGPYTSSTSQTTINDAMLCLGSQYRARIQSYKGNVSGPWSELTSSFFLRFFCFMKKISWVHT